VLDVADSQHHAPAALPLGKTQYTLYRRLSGPQGWSRWAQKISLPLGFDPWAVQPEVSCCTDYTIPAHQETPPLSSRKIGTTTFGLHFTSKFEIFKLYKDKHKTFLRVVDLLIYITLYVCS
jgi:hypothetical protein